ncbi:MAG TPA: SUF system NifU family Fe-S cluster assembly protein [Polyangiaceae bacterium LLY-WYZ-14_1]|nr:SUF system NifU family Fe-S cluster assembly protein [Polyangiaceae bacterium LLY-WYZ-14_1]
MSIDAAELRELYQEVILDHGKNPRNFRFPDPSNRAAKGHNPLCGDRLQVQLFVDPEGRIVDVGFEGKGCAISTASASVMTEAVLGKTIDEARTMFASFREMVTGGAAPADLDELDRLAVFKGVAEFPMRVKCATLAWHTLDAALDAEDAAPGKATTE